MPKISSTLFPMERSKVYNSATNKIRDSAARGDSNDFVYVESSVRRRPIIKVEAAGDDGGSNVAKTSGRSTSEGVRMYKITSGRMSRCPFIKVEPKVPEEALFLHNSASDEERSNPRRYACPSCPFNTLNVNLFREHVKLHSGVLSSNSDECTVVDITNTGMILQGGPKSIPSSGPGVEYSVLSSVSEESKENLKNGLFGSDSNDHEPGTITDSNVKDEPQSIEWNYTGNDSENTIPNEAAKGFGYLEVEADEVKFVKVEPKTLKQDTLKCPICSYNTPKKDHFNRHMSGHFRIRTFQCPECAYGTYRKDHLERHSLVHCKDKPVKCPKCPFATTRKYALLYHIRRHFKAKRYMCIECKFSTMSREEFRNHLKDCTAKFFLCSLCNYISQKKDQLQRHLRTHYKNVFTYDKSDHVACIVQT